MLHRDLYTLRDRLPECKLPSFVYDSYTKERKYATSLFMDSAKDFENLESFKLPTINAIRNPIPEESYSGLSICGLPLEEVGCGVLTLAQGLADSSEVVDRKTIEELTAVVEEKGYYLKGSGMYWHIFKYFAGHLAVHWHELVTAIECGNPVTVLLKYPENTRRLFTNLVSAKNTKADLNSGEYCVPLTDPSDYHFVISDGREVTLKELMNPEFLVTAPWVWPTSIG